MAKPYTGPADETCPHHLGELCSKVCPTCKFQQLFTIPGTDGVRYDCALLMHHVISIEGNRITQAVGAEIETFRNETVKDHRALIGGTVTIAQRAIEAAARQSKALDHK